MSKNISPLSKNWSIKLHIVGKYMKGQIGGMEMVEDGEWRAKRGQWRVASIYWLIMRRGWGDQGKWRVSVIFLVVFYSLIHDGRLFISLFPLGTWKALQNHLSTTLHTLFAYFSPPHIMCSLSQAICRSMASRLYNLRKWQRCHWSWEEREWEVVLELEEHPEMVWPREGFGGFRPVGYSWFVPWDWCQLLL